MVSIVIPLQEKFGVGGGGIEKSACLPVHVVCKSQRATPLKLMN